MSKLMRTFGPSRTPAPSRRSFLRGAAGGLLAIPFLQSLAPTPAHAAPGDPKRLLYWFLPNGFFMPNIIPTSTGPAYTLSPSLSPLSAFKDDMLVLTGLSNYGALGGEGGHSGGTAAYLTCAVPDPDVVHNGVSVDQIAAAAMAGVTPFTSIEAGMENGAGTGGCDDGTCAYGSNISWVDETTPRARVSTPLALFNRLFGGLNPTLSPEEQERRRGLRISVLDQVVEHANALRPRIGQADRLKLDAYLTSVRDLEVQVTSQAGTVCEPGDPPGSGLGFEARMAAFTDLFVLALQCDLTRVGTFMLGNAATNRSYDHIGIPESHHNLSHHGHDPAIHALLAQIDAWNMGHVVGYLLDKLKTTTDGEGKPLLENTLVYVSSELSDGHYHDNFDLIALAAGGGDTLQLGQHIATAGGAMADLHLALLEGFGVVETSLGHVGTGPLPGVLAP